MLLLSLLFAGCSWGERPAGRSTLLVELTATDGYAMNVVPDSRVQVADGVLGVDAPDGFRWMEVRWVEGQVGPAVTEWSIHQCNGLIWERSATPAEGVHTQAGMCTRNGEEYWTFLVLETRADRTLMTTWLAHREALPYEDAWVEFVGTALSLNGGDVPIVALEEASLRRLIRETARTSAGLSPVPGGGQLGAEISEALTDVWAARAAAALPAW